MHFVYMKNDNFDEIDQITGQMSISDALKDVPGELFAVSKVFADARKQMNLAEYKTLALALSNVKFKDKCPDIIVMDAREVAAVIGIKTDYNHIARDLELSIGDMAGHSLIKFSDRDKKMWVNGNFIRFVKFHYGKVIIILEQEYLKLFGDFDTRYLTMYSSDIFNMHSERSVLFYEKLRGQSDTREHVNQAGFGIRALKEMFDIPKDGPGSYMRDGHFDRSNFEKKVIEPLCEDLKQCKMVNLIIQKDGKYYEKVKNSSGRVQGYRFYWTMAKYPGVASAAEVKEIQERVDENPVILKIAKDIVSGEKKPKKNAFNDFEQRKPDYSEIEKKLFNQ